MVSLFRSINNVKVGLGHSWGHRSSLGRESFGGLSQVVRNLLSLGGGRELVIGRGYRADSYSHSVYCGLNVPPPHMLTLNRQCVSVKMCGL